MLKEQRARGWESFEYSGPPPRLAAPHRESFHLSFTCGQVASCLVQVPCCESEFLAARGGVGSGVSLVGSSPALLMTG